MTIWIVNLILRLGHSEVAPSVQVAVQTEIGTAIGTRTVATQAMVTYRRKKATPRFEVLRPDEDGAWSSG